MGRKRTTLLIVSILALGSLAAQEPVKPPEDAFQLGLVLKSARQYCARLEKAALDFICLEEVSEKLDQSRDRREAGMKTPPLDSTNSGTSSSGGLGGKSVQGRAVYFDSRTGPKFDNAYLYDYQFVRKVGKVGEKRVLLERNGKKAGPKTPEPQLLAFHFADILLAPVQVLDERFEEY